MTGAAQTDPAELGSSHDWQDVLDEQATEQLLSDRDRAVRDKVRRVVADHVAPHALHRDRTSTFAHDSYQALASAGLGGLLFPASLGGTADSTVAYAAAMEEIAAACPATSMIYMTQMHAAYPIWLAGTDAQIEAHVPRLIAGDAYGSLAITEPGAGSDVSSLATTARATASGYTISGAKTFITTGDRADFIVCFATTDRAAGRDAVTAFIVDGAAAGLSRGRPLAKLGLHASSTAELFFDDVAVDDSQRLGDVGSGWRLLLDAVIKSRISAAAQGVGIARGAYIRALAQLHAEHGDRLPQQVEFALAGMRSQILAGRLLLHATARTVDAADERNVGVNPATIAMMKQHCTDLGLSVALDAMRLLGSTADHVDLGVERFVRDAKGAQIYDGTNEIQRLLIARDTRQRAAKARP